MKVIITGTVVEAQTPLSLEELCCATQAEADFIYQLIEHELIHPTGTGPDSWCFDSLCLKRTKVAMSFYRELEVNFSGVALALDLLNEIEGLQQQIAHLKRYEK